MPTEHMYVDDDLFQMNGHLDYLRYITTFGELSFQTFGPKTSQSSALGTRFFSWTVGQRELVVDGYVKNALSVVAEYGNFKTAKWSYA